jgi:uncharacterized protein YcfJ
VKRLVRRVGRILKPALPIAGAVIGSWVGGKIGGMLGGAFGKTAGRVIGGLAGGVFGASGGRLQGSQSIQTHVPPYAQQGADILMQLLNQTSNISQTTANLTRPYIDKTIASMENIPSELRGVYSETEADIRRYFTDLLNAQQDIIRSEQTKQNLRLGALGLLNTQAQQWTLADILNRTAFETLRDKTQALTNLAGARTQSLVSYLFMRPEFYANITDSLIKSDPQILEFQTKMDIAKALMGVPTIVQPIYRRGLLDYLPAFTQLGTAFMLLRR